MAKSYTRTLFVGGSPFRYFDIGRFAGQQINSVPYSLRVLLENLMRHMDSRLVDEHTLEAVIDRAGELERPSEIPFYPARVLMQDFTGVPAIVDLAALRDAVAEAGKDPKNINPQVPVDLIVDHSVQIDSFGTQDSLAFNVGMEYRRNHERYSLLKWAQKSFTNLR
ncbi:MAG: aconitate hydratase, partial [Spirochaetae bacterium HGW-Spirochaetae-8]